MNDLNLTDTQLVDICHRRVEEYYTVDGDMSSNTKPLLHNPKIAFIKAHRIITGSSLIAAREFADGPGRFAVYELQTRVEERKKRNGEGCTDE